MNIALLHYSAPPVVGGVESVLAHHARLLANVGHQVRILAGRGAQTDARIPFIHLPLVDSRQARVLALKRALDGGHIPDGFAGLVAELCADLTPHLEGVEVLIAHNVCSLHKNLALTAALWEIARSPGSPRLVLWHHDLAWTTPRYRSELHPGFPWDLLRQAWPGARQVVVSQLRRGELSALTGISPDSIRVIPNGLDVPAFLKLEPQTVHFVQQLDLLSAAPLLLLPVRITPRKNLELALRALAVHTESLPDAAQDAALVVTGPPGPHNPANQAYFERLMDLRSELGLEGRAHFLAEVAAEQDPDYLPDAVIADFYRLADALLLPSREEGFGIPVLEAGLASLPVFCADLPPLRDLAGDQATYFSPQVEPTALAAAIAGRLAADPVYELRRRVRQEYTWEGIYVRQIAPLLESLRQDKP